MSDFLSNLAARSLGLVEVVRPRPASLFEPPRATVASGAGIPDMPSPLEEVGLDARPSAALEVGHFVEPPPASSSPPDGDEREEVHAIAPATSDPQGRQPIESSRSPWVRRASSTVVEGDEARPPDPPVAPATRSRVSPAPRPALVPVGVDDGGNASNPSWSESPRTVNELLGPSRDLGPMGVSRRQAVPPTVETDDVRPVLPPSAVRPSETDEFHRSGPDSPTTRAPHARNGANGSEAVQGTAWREPVRPVNEGLRGSLELRPSDVSHGEPTSPLGPGTGGPARVVVQPRVALYSEPVAPAHSRPAAVNAEPTIQVTIGRVEVRATHPAPPVTSRERRTPAAMSLEEYLRRRADGSAR
jgi:hypothetical protein